MDSESLLRSSVESIPGRWSLVPGHINLLLTLTPHFFKLHSLPVSD